MVKMRIARGDHFDRVKPGMAEMGYIGGPDRLQEIREAMEAVEPELEPCPFCGAPAVIESAWAYATPAVSVRCCRCGTPIRLEGLELLTRRRWTLEERAREAAELWNRRAAV